MKKLLALACVIAMLAATGCSTITITDKDSVNEVTEGTYILASDTQVVTEIDLSKLNDTELKYAYEEIFARHGKIYSDTNFKKYFNSQSWYTPNPSFEETDLSDIERENANYIKEYIASKKAEETKTQEVKTETTQVQVITVPKYDENYYYTHYYGDNTFIIPDSSVRRLTKSELYGYSANTLALIRNEIYARNGYIFSKKKYKDYFSSKLWYVPDSSFNEGYLNEIEKYNIQLIKSME